MDTAGHKTAVVGIGTVQLPTRTLPNEIEPGSQETLCLKKVLHAPSSPCNIIGHPLLKDHHIAFTDGPGLVTSLDDGRPVAQFEKSGHLYQILLASPPEGPEVGPSPLNPSETYSIDAFWPDEEQERFAALEPSPPPRLSAVTPLTDDEQAWLKEHFETEFQFLMAHSLNIYKEEDRQEGRAILRAVMTGQEDEIL
jgi:hypothetical protein